MSSRIKYRQMREKLEGNTKKRKKQLDTIYRRDQGICYSCHNWIPRDKASREHVKPLSTHPELARDLNNMKLACRHGGCNK